MGDRIKDYIRALSTGDRLRFLANLTLFIGQAARAEYRAASEQGADGYRQLRAFNEIYQEIAHQLLGELEGNERMPLELALTEKVRECASQAHLDWHVDWAINKAIEMLTSSKQA